MKRDKYSLQSVIEIQFKDMETTQLVYYSLYPDIKRTHSKYFEVNISIENSLIRFTVSANSIGKFRGIHKTIFRLLGMVNQLFQMMSQEI